MVEGALLGMFFTYPSFSCPQSFISGLHTPSVEGFPGCAEQSKTKTSAEGAFVATILGR